MPYALRATVAGAAAVYPQPSRRGSCTHLDTHTHHTHTCPQKQHKSKRRQLYTFLCNTHTHPCQTCTCCCSRVSAHTHMHTVGLQCSSPLTASGRALPGHSHAAWVQKDSKKDMCMYLAVLVIATGVTQPCPTEQSFSCRHAAGNQHSPVETINPSNEAAGAQPSNFQHSPGPSASPPPSLILLLLAAAAVSHSGHQSHVQQATRVTVNTGSLTVTLLASNWVTLNPAMKAWLKQNQMLLRLQLLSAKPHMHYPGTISPADTQLTTGGASHAPCQACALLLHTSGVAPVGQGVPLHMHGT